MSKKLSRSKRKDLNVKVREQGPGSVPPSFKKPQRHVDRAEVAATSARAPVTRLDPIDDQPSPEQRRVAKAKRRDRTWLVLLALIGGAAVIAYGLGGGFTSSASSTAATATATAKPAVTGPVMTSQVGHAPPPAVKETVTVTATAAPPAKDEPAIVPAATAKPVETAKPIETAKPAATAKPIETTKPKAPPAKAPAKPADNPYG